MKMVNTRLNPKFKIKQRLPPLLTCSQLKSRDLIEISKDKQR